MRRLLPPGILLLAALAAVVGTRAAPPRPAEAEPRPPTVAARSPAPPPTAPRAAVSAPPGRLTVRVRARSFDGRGEGEPVGGARVEVVDASGAVAADFADGAGEVRFRELVAGTAWLTVRAQGWLLATDETWISPRRTRRERIELVRPRLLRGRVVRDSDGTPVPGARIDVHEISMVVEIGTQLDLDTTWGTEAVRERAETDAEGRFELRRVGANGSWLSGPLLRVSAPGCRTVLVLPQRAPGGEPEPEFTVRLVGGGSLRGVVRGPDGRAVAGARVQAIPSDLPWGADLVGLENLECRFPGETVEVWGAETTTTAADGTFALDGLALGETVDIRISADGFSERRYPKVVRPTLSRPEATLALSFLETASPPVAPDPDPAPVWTEESPRRGVRVTGRVVDQFGRGVPGAKLSREPRSYWETRRDGSFWMGGLAPGRHEFRVKAEHCETRTATLLAPGEEQVVVLRRERGVVATLVLPPDVETACRRMSLNGWNRSWTPGDRRRWSLVLEPHWGEPSSEMERDFLEAEDVAEIESNVGRWRLRVLVEGAGWLERVLYRGPEPIDLGELVLAPAVRARGIVVDEAGSPVPWAGVSVDQPGWGHHGTVRAGRDGTFETPALAPDRIALRARVRGYLAGSASVVPGESGAPARIVLCRGVLLRVVVRDAEGHRLARREVEIEGLPEDECAQAWTDSTGTVTWRVAPGAYRVSTGTTVGDVRVDGDDPEATLDLRAP